ncbi:MAG: geranylgeranylglycerol-phosphate geranylgeranyltransferase [bacterium]
MRSRLSVWILITRPLNVALTGLSIGLAAGLVHTSIGCRMVLCALVSGMCIAAGANVINDVCDVDIDRVNKPQRVLPAGRMSVRAAQLYAIILFACGIIFSIFINLPATFIACGSTIVVIAYSFRFKRQPLIGNLAVSLTTALAFIYGALAACPDAHEMASFVIAPGGWQAGVFPALLAFLFHFGREIVKDIEDQIGDRAGHAHTLPLVYGLQAAQIAATVAFVLLAVAAFVPFALGFYHQPYLWCVLAGIYPVLVYALFNVWRRPDMDHMRRTSHILKADMLVGLLAIFVGS